MNKSSLFRLLRIPFNKKWLQGFNVIGFCFGVIGVFRDGGLWSALGIVSSLASFLLFIFEARIKNKRLKEMICHELDLWGEHLFPEARCQVENVLASNQSTFLELNMALSLLYRTAIDAALVSAESYSGVGNPACKYSAHSPHLRCAPNPCGPCEGCKFFEQQSP